jgi:hypothetical protein
MKVTATSNKSPIEQAPALTASTEGAEPAKVGERDAQTSNARTLLLLAGVVLLGGVARFWNLDWDAGHYTLHPDEWALNQVVERLGPDLNPHFFFYGSFPIYLYRATAELLTGLTGVDWLDTSRVSLVGRFYSALGSILMLPVIFLVGRRLWNATGGLLAAALAACAPLLIQAAHFGTVDTMVTLAAVVTLWLSLRLADGAGLWTVAAVGLVIGLAVATKLTAASFLLMPAIACLASGQRAVSRSTKYQVPSTKYWTLGTGHFVLGTGLVLLGTCAMTALIASPYYVLAWNELWAAIKEQTDELNGGYRLIYTWHFIGTTPYIFEGSNLLVWGVGLATGIAGLAGWALSVIRIGLRRAPVLPILLLVLWPTLYFLYVGTWEARFVRHTLPLVPFICLFAAGVLTALLRRKGVAFRATSPVTGHWSLVIGHWSLITPLVLAFSALWGLAFLPIYTSTDTRLAATDWFHANVPAGAHLVVEDKDTLVPLPDAAHPVQTYHLGVIEPTTPDSPAKLSSMASTLAGGEFLVLSSRRWSATIPRLPDFPTTGRYYGLLFAGKLGYTPVATFASPPRLGPLEFSDDSAEETFQVFDHPTVRVFRNTAHLPLEEIEQLLEK